MLVDIKSKGELQVIAKKIKDTSTQLAGQTADIISNLLDVEDFDEMHASRVATMLQNDLKKASFDAEVCSLELNNYVVDINNLDTYDVGEDDLSKSSSNVHFNSEGNDDKNKTFFGKDGKFKIV